ncbi:MAG: GMC family oxidoreductase N-terminal domain-containing protein [Planctomycetota bacterium]
MPSSEKSPKPNPPLADSNAKFGSQPVSDGVSRRGLFKRTAGCVAAGASLAAGTQAKADNWGRELGQVGGRRQTGPSVYKTQAVQDYRQNMAAFGGRLSAPINRLLQPVHRTTPWQFDVLVIGSGYGASISAARIASRLKPGSRLGILERGREWVPGTFPDRLPDVLAESRLKVLGRDRGEVNKATGLFNVQQFDEITILSGSGLGGSSLINANVAIRPDADVFTQPVWPVALRDRGFLDPYYALAEMELGVAREPWDHTHKMVAQRKAWEQLVASGADFEAANLTLTRGHSQGLPIINRQGQIQRPCIDCGDCLTGCNVGAKNTLAMNYLPMARRAGAEMFPQVEVNRVEKCGNHYKVHFTYHREDRGQTIPCHGVTTTRVLILGAGSLGSTEILMRSEMPTMRFSKRLGASWTGNGDALGFIRKTQYPTGIGGYSAYPTDRARVGPTIETNLTYPFRSLAGRVLIQDGTAARAYCNALGVLMRDLDLDHLQILLGMGHDGAEGQIRLNSQGRASVSWPGLLESNYRRLIRGEFARVADAMGGKYEYLKIFGKQMISVHPLGGCGMSDDPACGVTNHKGQVYDATYGGDVDPATGQPRVHDGLYVVDGAMLPTSIACNPLLTISALAERSADQMVAEPALRDMFV